MNILKKLNFSISNKLMFSNRLNKERVSFVFNKISNFNFCQSETGQIPQTPQRFKSIYKKLSSSTNSTSKNENEPQLKDTLINQKSNLDSIKNKKNLFNLEEQIQNQKLDSIQLELLDKMVIIK